jgi:hypothetical protein
MLAFAVYFAFIIIKPAFFGEFTNEFKKDTLCSKFYNAMILERLIVGMALVLLLKVNVEALLPMLVFIGAVFFIVLKRPYISRHQNIRQTANMSIVIVVECVYLAYRLTDRSVRNTSQIFFYLPLFVCGLLIACVAYSAVAIVFSIVKFVK